MSTTLKQRYDNKQVKNLQERVKKIDLDVLTEHKMSILLLEAMSDEDLDKVGAIIDKLRKIKTPQLPVLSKAIEQAEAELNKFTGGGPISKAWSKLKTKVGIDNPVVKITTFANALEKGFSQVPKILKNNGIDISKLSDSDLSKSLTSYLTGQRLTGSTSGDKKTGQKSDEEMAKSPFTGRQVESTLHEANDTESKLKNIVTQLRTALSPGGLFGAFKKVPYVDSAQLAQELLKAPLKVFANVARTINQGAKSSDVANDLKSLIQARAEGEIRSPAPGEPTAAAEQPQQTTSTTDTTAAQKSVKTGEVPQEPRGGGSEKPKVNKLQQWALKDIKEAGVDKQFNLSDEALSAVVAALANKGYFKK